MVKEKQVMKMAHQKQIITQLFGHMSEVIRKMNPLQNEQACEEQLLLSIRQLMDIYKIKLAELVAIICAGPIRNGDEDETEDGFDESELLYLHRANFRYKLMDLSTPKENKAHLLFQWRCLLQLCVTYYQKSNEEGPLSECRHKLVPTMTEFAEFAQNFLRRGLMGSGSEPRDVLATPARPAFPDEHLTSPPPPIHFPSLPASMSRHQLRREQHIIHFIMRQLFRIFPLLEMDDVGKQNWRELAFSVLANPTITLKEKFLQELVESMMLFHYPLKDQTEQAIHQFCDAINNIVTRGDNTHQQQQLQLANRSPSVSSSSSRDSSQHNSPITKLDEATRIRCLSIFNALLRSGRLIEKHVELEGLYEVLITSASLSADSAEERTMAYQCLTWRCMLGEEECPVLIPIIWAALKLHQDLDQGRALIPFLEMFGDIVRTFGYARVADWLLAVTNVKEGEAEEEEVVNDSFLVEEDEERAVSDGRTQMQHDAAAASQNTTMTTTSGEGATEDDADVDDEQARRRRMLLEQYICYSRAFKGVKASRALRATELLCIWLLDGCLNEAKTDELALAHLLLLHFNSELPKHAPRMHTCLTHFMHCFCSVSRRNQQLMVRAFIEAVTQLENLSLSLNEEANNIDNVKMAQQVVQFTAHSTLLEKAIDRGLGSVHAELAQQILEDVRDRPDQLYAATILHILPDLEPVEDQDKVQALIKLCTDTMHHFADVYEEAGKGKMHHLKVFWRNLNKRADFFRQAFPSTSSTGSEVHLNSARKRQNNARGQGSARKKAQPASLMNAAGQLTPSREGSAKKKAAAVHTPSGTTLRPMIARKAKANHRYFADISEQSDEMQRMVDSIVEGDGGDDDDVLEVKQDEQQRTTPKERRRGFYKPNAGDDVIVVEDNDDAVVVDDDIENLELEQARHQPNDDEVMEIVDANGWDFPLEPMDLD